MIGKFAICRRLVGNKMYSLNWERRRGLNLESGSNGRRWKAKLRGRNDAIPLATMMKNVKGFYIYINHLKSSGHYMYHRV